MDGTSAFASGASVMVGSSATNVISITISNLSSSTLGISALTLSTQSGANSALSARASIGVQESWFEFSTDSILTQSENLTAANSAITDVDIAANQMPQIGCNCCSSGALLRPCDRELRRVGRNRGRSAQMPREPVSV